MDNDAPEERFLCFKTRKMLTTIERENEFSIIK